MHNLHHQRHAAESKPTTRGNIIRWAAHYDLVVNLLTFGRENALRRQTIQYASIPAGATVLDVGCGTGTLTLLAKAAVGDHGSVYGLDASTEMIAVARQKAVQHRQAVNFQTGVIEALPFSDGTFDVVLSSLMVHHLPPDLKQRGLAEIYRVLRPGGHLMVVDIARPVTLAQRLTMMSVVHHGLTSDVYDLIPLMEQIGYTGIQSGRLSWRSIGFVQGSRGG